MTPRNHRRGLGLIAMLCGWLAASPSHAHPHVWIDYHLTVLFEAGHIIALQQDWSFDEDFSTTALHDLGRRPGATAALTENEITALHDKAFINLRNYEYFIHVWSNGVAVKPAKDASHFSASIQGPALRYHFTVPLTKPVDPRQSAVSIGLWDDSYYVDVGPALDGPAITLSGTGSEHCQGNLAEDPSHPIYYGGVIPKVVKITCKGE